MGEIEKGALQVVGKEQGRTGLKVYSGIVFEEELRQLQTYSIRHKIYREMAENDSVIGAVLYAIEMFIRKAPWLVQAFDDSPEAEENKTFLEECKDDMSDSWEDTIAEITNGEHIHGFSFHEIVYKYRQGQGKDPSKRSKYNDGRLGWRKFAVRDQESLSSWEFDKEGGLSAMVQMSAPDYNLVTIPIEKALLFRTTLRKANPEGISLLRKAYRAWYFKKKVETYEAIGIERDLAGLPVCYTPKQWGDVNASAGEKAAFNDIKDIVVNIKRDEQEGVVLPSVYDEHGNQLLKLELLNAGGKRNFDTNQVIQRYDTRIAMTMLAQFLLLGSGETGSWALSSSHTEIFANAVGVLLNSIASVINRHAIPRLFELNGKNLEVLPKFVPGDIESPDLAELGEYLSKLSGVGIDLTDHDLQNYLREAASLPLKPEEEEEEELNIKTKESEEEETLIEAVKAMRTDIQKAIND